MPIRESVKGVKDFLDFDGLAGLVTTWDKI